MYNKTILLTFCSFEVTSFFSGLEEYNAVLKFFFTTLGVYNYFNVMKIYIANCCTRIKFINVTFRSVDCVGYSTHESDSCDPSSSLGRTFLLYLNLIEKNNTLQVLILASIN